MTVLPHVGDTTTAEPETPVRKNNQPVYNRGELHAMWVMGMSYRKIAAKVGANHKTVEDAIKKFIRDTGAGVARSPVPSPPAADDHGNPGAGVDTAIPPGGETTGLRGAPAGPTNGHPGCLSGVGTGDNGVGSTTPAGAPIVREQHDPDGDLWYCLTLPSGTHHTTTSRTRVDSLLAPWDSMAVVWIQED